MQNPHKFSQADGVTATGAPEFPGHQGGQWSAVDSHVVASWPAGHFAENLAVDARGDVYISLHSHNRIVKFNPGSGHLVPFVGLPAPVAGLAFDAAGRLWATGGTVGETPGFIWRIEPSGSIEEWVRIPDASFLNGCAMHPNGRTLLACDSITGRVLAIDRNERSFGIWLADDRLRPITPQMPGANGIKICDGWAWISVTDHNRIMRAPIKKDWSAGRLEVAAVDLRADDFAFAESGALYIATHPAQTVMRLGVDGLRTTIAGPDQGAVGSTACAFGKARGDENNLYVTTNGGLWVPFEGMVQDAKLLRLSVGEKGAPS